MMPYRVSAVRAAVATHAPPLSVARRRPHNEACASAAAFCSPLLAALSSAMGPSCAFAAQGSGQRAWRWGRPSATASRVSDVAASDRDAAILVQLLLGGQHRQARPRRAREATGLSPSVLLLRPDDRSQPQLSQLAGSGPLSSAAPVAAVRRPPAPASALAIRGHIPDALPTQPAARPHRPSNQQSHAQHYHSTRIIRPKRPTKTSEAGHE